MTVKRRNGMSPQFSCGGGGGMHTVGYDAWQPPLTVVSALALLFAVFGSGVDVEDLAEALRREDAGCQTRARLHVRRGSLPSLRRQRPADAEAGRGRVE